MLEYPSKFKNGKTNTKAFQKIVPRSGCKASKWGLTKEVSFTTH